MTGRWSLQGYDRFEGTYYPLDPLHGVASEDYLRTSYGSLAEAQDAAYQHLARLEEIQPSVTSGGQSGLQDWVYIILPDGHKQRVLPVGDRFRAAQAG